MGKNSPMFTVITIPEKKKSLTSNIWTILIKKLES